MRAALVVTGTEVLEGRVRDENGAAIAASLTAHGVAVDRITVVGDALHDIRAAVDEALAGGPRALGFFHQAHDATERVVSRQPRGGQRQRALAVDAADLGVLAVWVCLAAD